MVIGVAPWTSSARALPKRLDSRDTAYIEASVKYEGYVAIQRQEVARLNRLQASLLPGDLDYACVAGLSSEVRLKLARARPATLGEAARIPGVTPAALNAIGIHLALKRKRKA